MARPNNNRPGNNNNRPSNNRPSNNNNRPNNNRPSPAPSRPSSGGGNSRPSSGGGNNNNRPNNNRPAAPQPPRPAAAASGPQPQQNVAQVTVTRNSNTPGETRTVTPINGATEAEAKAADLKSQQISQDAATAAAKPTGKDRQKAIKKAKSLGQGMKIALSNDGQLGGKEIQNLQKAFGAGSLKIEEKLNDLNSRLGAENGYGGFKANAWNRLNTGKYDTDSDKRSMFWGSMMNSVLGSGANEKFGFGTRRDKGFEKLAKGWSAYSVPGAGDQFRHKNELGTNGWDKYAKLITPSPTTDPTTDPNSDPNVDPGFGVTPGENGTDAGTGTDATNIGANQYGAGDLVGSTATSWSGRKSKRAKLGGAAQGYGSNIVKPGNAQGIGVNYGY